MATTDIVRYNDFEAENIQASSPSQKTVPKSNPPQSYNEIPLSYNYGDSENPRIGNFYLELPKLKTNGGLTEKPSQSGKMEYVVVAPLPIDNTECQTFIECTEGIWQYCRSILSGFKGQVGLGKINFTNDGAVSAVFRKLPYYPIDKITGEIAQGRNPTLYLKCYKRGFGAMEEKTQFYRPVKKTNVKGEPVLNDKGKQEITNEQIDWKLVQGVEMEFIPLVHVKKIYVGGGKASLQMEMVSAVVTSITPRGATSLQVDTLTTVGEDADLVDNLASQVATLAAIRRDVFDTPANASSSDTKPGTKASDKGPGKKSPEKKNNNLGLYNDDGDGDGDGDGAPKLDTPNFTKLMDKKPPTAPAKK